MYDARQSDPGKMYGLLLRVSNGGPALPKGTGHQESVSSLQLPDGDRSKSKEGIYPRAEGRDGRIAEKRTAGNGEKSESGAFVKGTWGR